LQRRQAQTVGLPPASLPAVAASGKFCGLFLFDLPGLALPVAGRFRCKHFLGSAEETGTASLELLLELAAKHPLSIAGFTTVGPMGSGRRLQLPLEGPA